MQKTTKKWNVLGFSLIFWISLSIFAGNCGAELSNVKEIIVDAGKYGDRQVQIEGKVERWVALGNGDKIGVYVLKDNFGGEIQVKTMETLPPVGESVIVKGLVIFDSEKNEYYLQSLKKLHGSDKIKESDRKITGNRSFFGLVISPDFSISWKLISLATVAILVLLFIGIIAVRVKQGKNKVFDVPDFSFDETETIIIDVNGQVIGSDEVDETTVVLMPGHFRISRGPNDLEGKQFHLTSVLTKIGREESTVDKSSGWISFPSCCTTISRHQADLVFKGGFFYIESKSRSIITKLNGVPLDSGEPVKLSDKDIIAFSDIELTYLGSQLQNPVP